MTVLFAALGSYYFSGNIPDILIPVDNTTEVQIKIARAGQTDIVITESYDPVEELGIYVNIGELVHHELEMMYDAETIFTLVNYFEQAKAVATVTITPAGIAPKSFIAVRGSLDTEDKNFDFLDFFRKNLLNMGPQIRQVRPDEPVYFNIFSDTYWVIKAKAYLADGSSSAATAYITRNTQNYLSTINVTWEDVVAELFSLLQNITHIDIWGESTESVSQTHGMRLVLNEDYREYSDYFLFENSIGGLETIHLTGQKTEELRHEFLRAKTRTQGEGTHEKEYQTVPLTAFNKNTGWIYNEEQRRYILDFIASSMRFHFHEEMFRRMYIIDYEGRTTPGQLNSKEFTFAYSKQYTGQLPSRNNIGISDPGSV